MKIGLIVHSHTGNTLSVAESIVNRLKKSGKSVELERVSGVNEDLQNSGPVVLDSNPDISAYDLLILAAPVQAFSLSPIMKAWLNQEPGLRGKRVVCFVTEHFPYPWMGGTRAMKQFTRACLAQGADIVATGVVNWSNSRRSEQIEDLGSRIERILN
jgi:flavodoxin